MEVREIINPMFYIISFTICAILFTNHEVEVAPIRSRTVGITLSGLHQFSIGADDTRLIGASEAGRAIQMAWVTSSI